MKRILLFCLTAVFALASSESWAQDRTVSGRVTSVEDGSPLPGVNIVLKGTTNGTATDVDGRYTLSVPASGGTLIFSFIGLESQEIEIGTRTSVDLSMSPDVKQLTEVVVTAFNVVRKPDEIGYSYDQVGSEELTRSRSNNFINGMAGKVAGLQIVQTSSGVNSASRVTMRGSRSFTGDAQPLYVIDGIPVDNTQFQPSSTSASQIDVGNRVGDINPDDIQSVYILKGPSAAAQYGSRASNGAIIITTKSGADVVKKGRKSEVSYTTSYTMQDVMFMPKFQHQFGQGYDLNTYVPYENTSWGPAYDGSTRNVGSTLSDGSRQQIIYSDKKNHIRDFYETGSTFQNNVSFSGGDQKSTFFMSAANVNVKGIVPKDEFKRNNVRFNGTTRLSDKLTARANVSYNRNIQDVTPTTDIVDLVMNTPSSIRLTDYKDWRNNKFATPNGYFNGYYENPYWTIDNNRYKSVLDRIQGNIEAVYSPAKWVDVTYRLGTDVYTDQRKTTRAKVSYTGAYDRPSDDPGSVTDASHTVREFTSDLLFTFKKNFGDFTTQAILINSIRQRDYRYISQSANALVIPGLYNISNRLGEATVDERQEKQRVYGYVADVTVGYKNYVTLSLTGRNDHSSTLPTNKNSYFYPGANLSVMFTEAIPTLRGNNILSSGKLRGGIAKVGKDTNPYQLATVFQVESTTSTETSYGFPYGGLAGYTLGNTVQSATLSPEFTTSYEIGTELAFFNERINLDATIYKTVSTDQIFAVPITSTTGFSSATINAGEMDNSGIELALNTQILQLSNGLEWTLGINYSYNKSKVVSLYKDSKELSLGSGNPVPRVIVGQPFPVLYGTGYERDPQGRVIVNEDGLPIASQQNKNLGQVAPKYIMGFNTSLSFKGVTLAAVVEARGGNKFYSGTGSTLTFTGGAALTAYNDRQPFVYPNSVQEVSDGVFETNTTKIDEPGGAFDYYYYNYRSYAENFVRDASFVKVREISLAYDFPKALISKIGFINRASLSLVGRNLFMFLPSDNPFADPEANVFGTSQIGREIEALPPTRNYGATLNLVF